MPHPTGQLTGHLSNKLVTYPSMPPLMTCHTRHVIRGGLYRFILWPCAVLAPTLAQISPAFCPCATSIIREIAGKDRRFGALANIKVARPKVFPPPPDSGRYSVKLGSSGLNLVDHPVPQHIGIGGFLPNPQQFRRIMAQVPQQACPSGPGAIFSPSRCRGTIWPERRYWDGTRKDACVHVWR